MDYKKFFNKVIFLDRDGILNQEIGDYVCKEADFHILENNVEPLLNWQSKGYQFIVVTNQGGIAKGLYTHEILRGIHTLLIDYYASVGIQFLEIYYSPDHPEHNGLSLSRKPNSMMLEKAIYRFKVSIEDSFFIGDNQRDIEAGESIGLKSLLIESNSGLGQLLPIIP